MAVSKWYALIALILTPLLAVADGLPEGKVTLRDRDLRFQRPQGYIEYLPAGYGGPGRSPLLIDLTGRMEWGNGQGDSLAKLKNNGVQGEIRTGRWPKTSPFVVLSPQHHEFKTCPSGEEIDRFIQFAKERYHVDTDRIYLSGLSCGARGIADYLKKFGGKDVAAVATFSGDLTPAAERGCALANQVALFGMHGGKDDIIKIGPDRQTFQDFAKCPNRRDVDYLEYPDAGHGDPFVWGYARNDRDYFQRMLKYTKVHPAPVQTSTLVESAR